MLRNMQTSCMLSLTKLSDPISSIISIVDPSAVAKSKHPFIKNFMLPVPEASCPAVLQDNYCCQYVRKFYCILN